MTIFFDLKETLAYRHRSRSSHFRDIKNGICTTPINVGPRSTAWLRSDLEALRSVIIAGKSEPEIKLLVLQLEELRRTGPSKLMGGHQ
jgi:predicted DNA-binding transcriptional regulator AlpA